MPRALSTGMSCPQELSAGIQDVQGQPTVHFHLLLKRCIVCAVCASQVPNKRLLHSFHLPEPYVTWVKSLMEMGLKDRAIIKREALAIGQHV